MALAIRAGLRELPWLGQLQDKQDLALWSKANQSQHLLVTLQVYETGIMAVCNRKVKQLAPIADTMRAASVASTVTTTCFIADAAAFAAAANFTVATDFLAFISKAKTTANATANAIASVTTTMEAQGIVVEFTQNIKNDLIALKKNGAKALLEKQLWDTPPTTWLLQLRRFQTEVIALASNFEDWLAWYDARCRGDTLDTAQLKARVFLPESITSQDTQAINSYLASLSPTSRSQPTTVRAGPLNRVRTIFIGDGEAGKTSLIRVLHNKPVVEGIEPKTPGIAISEWPVPATPITASFWDFGGQVMVHATHQLFLRESCLYVLLVSSREREKATARAEYWLEHVKSFGKGAPVLIVANKADKEPVRLDENLLMGKYPGMIQGFFQLSTTEAKRTFRNQFDAFKQALCQQLQAVGLHQVQFQQAHFAVLQNLRQRTPQQAFLTHQDYDQLCNEHRVNEHGVLNSVWLLDILDKLGVIIHFPDITETEEYILNPRWLTYGVYTIMYHGVARLARADAVKLLAANPVEDQDGNKLTYPPGKCRVVFEAMRRYKLCYFLPRDQDQMIIPALLPSDIKQHGFDYDSALEFHYQFESFLPRHLISELIVECHEEIAQIGEQDIVWQHGVLLANQTHQTRVLIQADYHFRRLSIWLTRGSNTADMLATLRDRVERIVSRIDIKYDRKIRLPSEALEPCSSTPLEAEWADFGQLLAMRNKNRSVYDHPSGSEYGIAKILGLFEGKTGNTTINNNPIYNQNTTKIKKSNVGGNAVTGTKVKKSFNKN